MMEAVAAFLIMVIQKALGPILEPMIERVGYRLLMTWLTGESSPEFKKARDEVVKAFATATTEKDQDEALQKLGSLGRGQF